MEIQTLVPLYQEERVFHCLHAGAYVPSGVQKYPKPLNRINEVHTRNSAQNFDKIQTHVQDWDKIIIPSQDCDKILIGWRNLDKI